MAGVVWKWRRPTIARLVPRIEAGRADAMTAVSSQKLF